MKQITILKLDSVEVLQSPQGVISFVADDATDAFLDLTARIFEFEAMLENRLELIYAGIAANYSGDPQDNPLYRSVLALLKKGKLEA